MSLVGLTRLRPSSAASFTPFIGVNSPDFAQIKKRILPEELSIEMTFDGSEEV